MLIDAGILVTVTNSQLTLKTFDNLTPPTVIMTLMTAKRQFRWSTICFFLRDGHLALNPG